MDLGPSYDPISGMPLGVSVIPPGYIQGSPKQSFSCYPCSSQEAPSDLMTNFDLNRSPCDRNGVLLVV